MRSPFKRTNTGNEAPAQPAEHRRIEGSLHNATMKLFYICTAVDLVVVFALLACLDSPPFGSCRTAAAAAAVLRAGGERNLRARDASDEGTAQIVEGWWTTNDTASSGATITTTATTTTTTTTTSSSGNASSSSSTSLQPRVTVVEGLPSQCGIASISNPAGTPWCQGLPTYWVTGHQLDNERPRCLMDGVWVVSNTTELNNSRDRHFCVTMDVNKDGLDDIICNVGGGGGQGLGYNELWITDASGSVEQLLNKSSSNPAESPSGLQKYLGMRNRVAATLRNATGERKFVFMGTLGFARTDGLPNQHRMFKNVYSDPDTFPYFVEVPGPWTLQLFNAKCAISGDFSGDGVDDLVVCNYKGPALLSRQVGTNETFVPVTLPSNTLLTRWANARLADVTGDGRTDLVVVSYPLKNGQPSYLTVFRGIAKSPYFNFTNPYYRQSVPFLPTDVEVLDVNSDGKADIYVVQVNNTSGSYCGPHGTVIRMPEDVVPPLDTAHDLLFLGGVVGAAQPQKRFQVVTMAHAQPGCGAIAQRWGNRTMLLSQGSFDESGYLLLLEW